MKRFIQILSNLRRGLLLLALVLFVGLGLTACKYTVDQPPPPQDTPPPPPPPPPSPSDGVLTVTLPADPGAPPTVSNPLFRARAGASVEIDLVDQANHPAQRATVLRFQEAAFQNPGGQPMKTVPLTPGRNVFTVRNYADGVCREEQGGCKYDVVNTGEPGRPVLDPHVIIWQ